MHFAPGCNPATLRGSLHSEKQKCRKNYRNAPKQSRPVFVAQSQKRDREEETAGTSSHEVRELLSNFIHNDQQNVGVVPCFASVVALEI